MPYSTWFTTPCC